MRSVDRISEQLFNLVDPIAQSSVVQDIQYYAGYSLDFTVTGTLSFTAEIYIGNTYSASTFKFLSSSTKVITNAGYLYDVGDSPCYGYLQVRLSAITGTGTLKCQFIAKG